MNQLARDVFGEVPAEAEQVHQGCQQEGPQHQIPGGLEGQDLEAQEDLQHQVPEGEGGHNLAVQGEGGRAGF